MALLSIFSPSNQQRLLGISAGVATAAFVYISTQRLIWKNAAEVCEYYGVKQQARNPEDDAVWGPRTRALMVQKWNRTVDNTVGTLAAELARRGW